MLLYATAILFPLIYLSGFFRNQNPTGLLETLRGFVPFAYANDALKNVFGLTTGTAPLEVFAYPTIICAVLVFLVCLTAPRLLSSACSGGGARVYYGFRWVIKHQEKFGDK